MSNLAKNGTGQLGVERAKQILAECVRADEAKDIRDKAQAIQVYQRSKGASAESMADCAEIIARADIRLGQLLAETPMAKGVSGQVRGATAGRGSRPLRALPVEQGPQDEPQLTEILGMAPEQKDAAWKISSKTQKLAKQSKEKQEEYVAKQRAKAAAFASGAKETHVAQNTGNNEWYTPAEYIEAAREVLGVIDLDPASSAVANETVRAGAYYTAENSGLDRDWAGKVWMNPPYAAVLIGKFCSKLVEHVEAGDVDEAIVLVNNGTETAWGQALLSACSAVCFPSARIRFVTSDGEKGSPLQGQMIVYFGENAVAFDTAFKGFGVVR